MLWPGAEGNDFNILDAYRYNIIWKEPTCDRIITETGL